jgi:transmembrane sensor
MKDSGITNELLVKYLNGKCDEDEVELVEKWYAKLDGTNDRSFFNQKTHLKKIRKVIESEENGQHVERSFTSRFFGARNVAQTVFRYLAAAVVVFVAGFSYYTMNAESEIAVPSFVSEVKVKNESARVLRRSLPDGSTVWLNPGAILIYPNDFGNGERNVVVDGEIFFDVFRDEAHPFVVHSGTMVTRVLGTSFNVRANKNENNFEVAVVTGKVEVSSLDRKGKGRRVTLLPRQKATYHVSDGDLIATRLPEKQVVIESWQPVSLTFEDEKLDEVVSRLEKKFGMKISLENPELKNCKLRAVFEQQRLAEILDMITAILETTYEMKNNEVILKGRGCSE